jgi:AcrR family transcriptional regulator
VVARLQEQELRLAQTFAEETAGRPLPDARAFRDLFFELMDRLLEQMAKDPARARLYVRRWLSPDDVARPDSERNAAAFQQVLTEIFERAARAGMPMPAVDVPMLLRSFDWLVLGYFVTGLESRETFDERAVARFREFLRKYLCRMLGLPE